MGSSRRVLSPAASVVRHDGQRPTSSCGSTPSVKHRQQRSSTWAPQYALRLTRSGSSGGLQSSASSARQGGQSKRPSESWAGSTAPHRQQQASNQSPPADPFVPTLTSDAST